MAWHACRGTVEMLLRLVFGNTDVRFLPHYSYANRQRFEERVVFRSEPKIIEQLVQPTSGNLYLLTPAQATHQRLCLSHQHNLHRVSASGRKRLPLRHPCTHDSIHQEKQH